jgi:hypothetical protein
VTGYEGKTKGIALLKLKLIPESLSSSPKIMLLEHKLIDTSNSFDPAFFDPALTNVMYLGEKFFLVSAENSYSLDLRGNLKSLRPAFGGQNLEARIWIKYLRRGRLYESHTNGDSWNYVGDGRSALASTYTRAGRITFMYEFDRLYEVRMQEKKWYQLDTKGLPQNRISGINLLQDTLYVSTQGAGVYKKAVADLKRIEN